MKLYIKEFYKSAERYFLCKENHITLYKPYYVLCDLKNKCYLRPVSVFSPDLIQSLSFIPIVKNVPFYYAKIDLELSAFVELGIIPHDDTVYPPLYCQNRFGKELKRNETLH